MSRLLYLDRINKNIRPTISTPPTRPTPPTRSTPPTRPTPPTISIPPTRPTPTIPPTPLVFNDSTDTTNMANVLLIDSTLVDKQQFYDSTNSNTFPIIYDYKSKTDDLLALFRQKFPGSSIQRISLVFHDKGTNFMADFMNNKPLFEEIDLAEGEPSFSENVSFLISTINEFHVAHIDFLACNTLQYSNWTSYYELLSSKTAVVVGASNDKTGNLNYGGDWIMENTHENVRDLYFNANISNYASTLAAINILADGASDAIYLQMSGSDMQYVAAATPPPPADPSWTTISSGDWPVTITNSTLTPGPTNILRVVATDDLIISSSTGGVNGYFIAGTSYITFDGSVNTITMDTITNYLGFIQNGTSAADGFANVIVKNFTTEMTSSTLANYAGWLCQQYFGTGVSGIEIINCTNTGLISGEDAGGIAGYWVAAFGGSATFDDCANSGEISGESAGGIAGQGAGFNGSATFTGCENTGVISGDLAGGIAGQYAGDSGSATFTGCTNTGVISGEDAGGIAGTSAGFDGSASFTGCENSGFISGDSAGGIAGHRAGEGYGSSGSATFTDCTNSGEISGQSAGGIAGASAGASVGEDGSATFTGCENNGVISGTDAGGIAGASAGLSGSATFTDCINTGLISGLYAGGIAGVYVGIYGLATITGCTNSGVISGEAAGGIAGQYAGENGSATFDNCENSVEISGQYAGGIAGQFAGATSGSATFTDCGNTGPINGFAAGGIAGRFAGENSGSATFTGCTNTGVISASNAGGIAGTSAGYEGLASFTGCENTGLISGDSAGGIAGQGAGEGNVVSGLASFTNCTNSGLISGDLAGGIAGEYAGIGGGSASFTGCTNSGLISGDLTGGIAGQYAGDSGSASFTGCKNTGTISGQTAGGIAGQQAGSSGSATFTDCTNTGDITSTALAAAGIVGVAAGADGGSATLTNCFSSGLISGDYAGGIAGAFFAANTSINCVIRGCYSTGAISGSNAGGIVGAFVGYTDDALITPNVTIENCYSLGAIATTAGGICGGEIPGLPPYAVSPIITITNCYSFGTIADTGSGIVSILYPEPTIKPRTYFANNNWSDAAANVFLISTPTGLTINNLGAVAVWITLATNTPYILSAYNAALYSPNSASTSSSSTYESPAGLFSPGYTYRLLYTSQVGNVITAHVFVSQGTPPYYYAYNYNTFTLTTLSGLYTSSVTINPSTGALYFILSSPPQPNSGGRNVPMISGGGGGAFWFGREGFLFKSKGGGGARRSTKMAPGGNTTCNGPTYIYNKFKPGGGGVGASSVANRRAKNRLATICGPQNNKCFPCYTTLGQYSNYTHNPNGYVPCPPPQSNVCDLLPTDTPYQVCSPWPQFGGLYNNQQRRTPITSSQGGNILWESSNTTNLVVMRTASPIIASDGTIYIGLTRADETTGDPVAGYFAAFYSNGTTKWVFPLENGDINDQACSAIGPDGTNYFVASNDTEDVPCSYLYAITPSGTQKWRTQLLSAVNVSASIAIGINGEIFVCSYNTSDQGIIYAVNTNGGIISGYPIVITGSDPECIIVDGPAISTSGQLYVCAYDSTGGNNGALYSINTITKQLTWGFSILQQGVPYSSPILSSDESVVYFTYNTTSSSDADSLYALDANDTTPKWQYTTALHNGLYDTFAANSSIAIGADGTLYVVVNGYANDILDNSYGKLVAINASTGAEKWTYIFGSVSNITASFVDTSPTIGGDGLIYVGVEIYDVLAISPSSPTNIYLTMFAITPTGQLKWKTITTTLNNPGGVRVLDYATSPAIGLDGTLYIGATNGDQTNVYIGYSKLYAIK